MRHLSLSPTMCPRPLLPYTRHTCPWAVNHANQISMRPHWAHHHSQLGSSLLMKLLQCQRQHLCKRHDHYVMWWGFE